MSGAWSDVPLDLGLPDPVAKKVAHRPPQKGARWSRYKVIDKGHCDICVKIVEKNWLTAFTRAPDPAVKVRTAPDGGKTYFCWQHAVEQEAADAQA